MKRILLFAVLTCALARVQGQAVTPKHQFPVFDATGFTQKPDLTQYGLKPITVVYYAFMWDESKGPDAGNLPDSDRISALAQLANQSTRVLVIDIEHWPLTGDDDTVAGSIKKFETVIKWFKAPAPSLKVGYYGVVPIRDYWDALQEGSPRYVSWQKKNDNVASIAKLADVLFPSIYTFYEDRNGWLKYAIAQIQEARRHADGKPVYAFLWPQYHNSNKKLANTFLPGDYWRMELDTARKYADGVVIWCCSNKQAWDGKAPWWLETQDFLSGIDSDRK
jgi:hypothetical protein